MYTPTATLRESHSTFYRIIQILSTLYHKTVLRNFNPGYMTKCYDNINGYDSTLITYHKYKNKYSINFDSCVGYGRKVHLYDVNPIQNCTGETLYLYSMP